MKSKETAKQALADGIRQAYAPLFSANEQAHSLSTERLKGLVAQVAGTDDDMTNRIVATLSGLIKKADFSSEYSPKSTGSSVDIDSRMEEEASKLPPGTKPMRPEFHYNIQIHLPNNATEDVYLNIFNALRKTFQ